MTKHTTRRGAKLFFIAAVSLTVALAPSSVRADGPALAPHSVVANRTLGEWSARWWKWAFAFPVNDNPLLDTTGAKSKFGDVGPVFFLAGLYNASGSVTRTATISDDQFIFFPLQNFENDNVGVSPRQTIDTLVSQLNGAIPSVTALHASIDGNPINGLFSHRETAPAFAYTLQLTDNLQQVVNNITTPDAAGTVFPAVADGFYLMLEPLSPGKHTLKFGGTSFGFTLDVIYHLTVVDKPSPAPTVLVP